MEEFLQNLEMAGYRRLNGCEEGISIMYGMYADVPYAVCVIDCDFLKELTSVYIGSIEERTRKAFAQYGYNYVKVLKIYITSEVDRIKYVTSGTANRWLVDKKNNRLIVYEDQPEEFLDIRQRLERVLYGEVKPRSARIKKKSLLTMNNLLILINIIVFIILAIGGNVYSADYMKSRGAMQAKLVIEQGQVYRLMFAMFMHFGIEHLLGNMIIMFIAGNMLERFVGWFKYTIIYIGGGLIAFVMSCLFYYLIRPQVVAAGASGAIFAIIGALISLALFDRDVRYHLRPINIILLAVYLVGSSLFDTGVDNVAHIVGLISGFAIALIMIIIKNGREKQ